MAVIIDGKATAAEAKTEIRSQAMELRNAGIIPGLAVIMAGNNPASKVYVKNKKRDCGECLIESYEYLLSADSSQEELLELIGRLNADSRVHGILVQLPLPGGFDEARIIRTISPSKDVDAFHPENTGLVMSGNPRFMPCTPAGVMELLDKYGIDPAGKECVVIGRSDIVGKPMAMMLLHRHGTVTICHSKTANLPEQTRRADILVSAAGKLGLITGDMIKPGAVVIDVAINSKPDGKLTGDVVFDQVEKKASFITRVPGGVGPMTRVILLRNTLKACIDLTGGA